MLEASRILTALGWTAFGVGITVYGVGISLYEAGDFEETIGLILTIAGIIVGTIGMLWHRQLVED